MSGHVPHDMEAGMSGHVPHEVLSALADGEAGAEERRTAHEHLLDCPDCQRVFREYSEVRGLLAGLPRQAAPESLVTAVLGERRTVSGTVRHALRGPRRYAVAAAGVFVVAVSLAGLARPVDHEPPPVQLYVARHASVSVQNDVTGQVIFSVTGR